MNYTVIDKLRLLGRKLIKSVRCVLVAEAKRSKYSPILCLTKKQSELTKER